MIIHENKYIRSTYNNGSISYFTNGVSCAKALHVSNNTITQRLNDGKPIKIRFNISSKRKKNKSLLYS